MRINKISLSYIKTVNPLKRQSAVSFTSNEDVFIKRKERLSNCDIREILKHVGTIKKHAVALLKRSEKIKDSAKKEYEEVKTLIQEGIKNDFKPILNSQGNIIRSFEVSPFGQTYMIETKDKKIARMTIFNKDDIDYSLSILKNVKGNYPPNYAQHCYTYNQGKLVNYKKGCYKNPDGSKNIKEEFKFENSRLSLYKKDLKRSFDGSVECSELFSWEPLLNMVLEYQKNSKKSISQLKGCPLYSADEIIYFRNNKIDELKNYKNYGGDCYKETYERIRIAKKVEANPLSGTTYDEITDFINKKLTKHRFKVNKYSPHFNFDK